MNILKGNLHTFYSADTDENESGDFQYPVEYLNSIKGPQLPPANLKFKIGAPIQIMILRNSDPTTGVCSGTHAILTNCTRRVLEARILGGDHAGKSFLIPRITITLSDLDLPFVLNRCQFPVCLGFSMSINKSQGQSVTVVGLNLCIPVFTHGQLYVALSWCTTKQGVKILFPEGMFIYIAEVFMKLM